VEGLVRGIGVLLGAIALAAASAAGAGAAGSTVASSSACHKSYKGACLKTGIGDYDCGGGRGNGPDYVWKTVRVVGPDVFRLDADRDGLGCEPY
jgi:hypothetical protein